MAIELWADGGTIGLIAVAVVGLEALALFTRPLWLFYGATLRRGPRRPEVSLTIDDGPDPISTPRWLEALASAGIKATFFCPGEGLQRRPDLARAIVRAGHELGNHSFSHPWDLALQSEGRARKELADAHRAIARFATPGNYFRPVAGVMSPPLLAAARALGLGPLTWTARARDGGPLRVGARQALRRLCRGLVPGGILVLHDNPRSPGPAIVAELVAEAKRRGLRFVTVQALLAHEPAMFAAGAHPAAAAPIAADVTARAIG